MEAEPSSPSVLKLLGLIIAVIVPIIYFIIALNTGDLLWLSPFFTAQPTAIIIHCYGNDVLLDPDSPEYGGFTNRVNEVLTGRKRWDALSLSAATYREYQHGQNTLVVELLYDPPVRIHSHYKFFSKVDTIVIPLVGRHAHTNVLFGRRNNYPVAGSLHVKNTATLVEYLATQGICSNP